MHNSLQLKRKYTCSSPDAPPLSCRRLENSLSSCAAMARFFLRSRSDKDIRCNDLNAPHTADESTSYPTPNLGSVARTESRSPWELGCPYLIDRSMAADMYKRIVSVEDIDKYVYLVAISVSSFCQQSFFLKIKFSLSQ